MAHTPAPDVRPLVERPDLFRHEVARSPRALAMFWGSAVVLIGGVIFGIVAYEWLDSISDTMRSRRARALEWFPFILAFVALIAMVAYGKRALIGDDAFTWLATGERLRERTRFSRTGLPEDGEALSTAIASRDPRAFAPLGKSNAGLVGGRILTAPGARIAIVTVGYLHRKASRQHSFAPTLFEGADYDRLMLLSTKELTTKPLSNGTRRRIDESYAAAPRPAGYTDGVQPGGAHVPQT